MNFWNESEPLRETWVGQAIAAWILKVPMESVECKETSPGFVYSNMEAISPSTGRIFTYVHKCDEGKVLWWHGDEGGERTFTPKERIEFAKWCRKNNIKNSYF